MLEDNASKDNFITHKVVTKLRLLGKPTTIFLMVRSPVLKHLKRIADNYG